MKETEMSKKLEKFLSTPESYTVWKSWGLNPMQPCPKDYKKKAGAQSDVVFLDMGKTCLIIENKCNKATITERQKRLYLNHFMHFINKGLNFEKYILVFLCDDKHSNYYEKLERQFISSNNVPSTPMNKTKLKILEKPNFQQIGNRGSYFFKKVEYRDICSSITIEVRLEKLDFSILDQLKKKDAA